MKKATTTFILIAACAFGTDIRENVSIRMKSKPSIVISLSSVNELKWGDNEKQIIEKLGHPNGKIVWDSHAVLIFGTKVGIQMHNNKFSGIFLSSQLIDPIGNEGNIEIDNWNPASWILTDVMSAGENIDSVKHRNTSNWHGQEWDERFITKDFVAIPIVTIHSSDNTRTVEGVYVINRKYDIASDTIASFDVPCVESGVNETSTPSINVTKNGINDVSWGISEDSLFNKLGNPNAYFVWDKHSILIYGKSIAFKFSGKRMNEVCFADNLIASQLSDHQTAFKRWGNEDWDINGIVKKGNSTDSIKLGDNSNWKNKSEYTDSTFKINGRIYFQSSGGETIGGACIQNLSLNIP